MDKVAKAGFKRYLAQMADILTRAERVQRRHARLRAAGLRPVRIWVQDTREVGFAEECARQIQLIQNAETPYSLAEDEAWFEASDKAGWTA